MMSFAQWGNALYSGDKSYAVIPKRKIFVGLAAGVIVVGFALVAILGEGAGSMPGNIAYLIGEDAVNPDAIWIVELWDSKDAHMASLQLPEVRAAIAEGRPLVAGFGTRAEFKPVAKAGA